MGAESHRPYTYTDLPWVASEEPGWRFDREWGSGWMFGLLVDAGPVEFGVTLWLGPAYVSLTYRRASTTEG